jgi:hypothetical protein
MTPLGDPNNMAVSATLVTQGSGKWGGRRYRRSDGN